MAAGAENQVYEWPAGYKPSPLLTDEEAKILLAQGDFPKSTKPSPLLTDEEAKMLLKQEEEEALSNAVEEADKAKIAKNQQGLYNEGDTGNSSIVLNKPYAKGRPKYGANQEEQVWNAHLNPETGTVTDPSGATIVWDRTKPRNGQWDMGHKPDNKYSDIHAKYMSGEMSKEDFLKWYRDPVNYRPELPSTNRSHLFE